MFFELFLNEQTSFSNIFLANNFFYNFKNPQVHPSQKNLQIFLVFFQNLHLCQQILLN